MANKQDAKSTRIAALEQLIVVLRRQNNAMRVSLVNKDEKIEYLQLMVTALVTAEQSGGAPPAGRSVSG